MNKLQSLLIAGLLSLTSVSFATSVTFVNSGGLGNALNEAGQVASGEQAGTIYLDDDGTTAIFGGYMGGALGTTGTAWYELNVNFSGINSYGKITNTTLSDPSLTYSFLNMEDDSVYNGYENLVGFFNVALESGTYKLLLSGEGSRHYDGDIAAVPVPAAGILFATALLGAGALGRRKKKSTKASMVGAFARAS